MTSEDEDVNDRCTAEVNGVRCELTVADVRIDDVAYHAGWHVGDFPHDGRVTFNDDCPGCAAHRKHLLEEQAIQAANERRASDPESALGHS